MINQRWKSFAHAISALLPLFAVWTASSTPNLLAAEQDYAGDVTDVIAIDALDPRGPYNKIWEPYIAKWTDQHYVAAYGLQVRGKLDMGDIVCSISRDAGRTWSPRIMVFDHRARNGTVQYAYNIRCCSGRRGKM